MGTFLWSDCVECFTEVIGCGPVGVSLSKFQLSWASEDIEPPICLAHCPATAWSNCVGRGELKHCFADWLWVFFRSYEACPEDKKLETYCYLSLTPSFNYRMKTFGCSYLLVFDGIRVHFSKVLVNLKMLGTTLEDTLCFISSRIWFHQVLFLLVKFLWGHIEASYCETGRPSQMHLEQTVKCAI